MAKTILRARPHSFIVAEMTPFLEQTGYAARKLENLSDRGAHAKASVGAVISLAISMSIGGSAEDIFNLLKKEAPQLPVLFAAMLTLGNSQHRLKRIARQAGIDATITGVSAENEHSRLLGKAGTFLYISKDDLAAPERNKIASRLIQRHFH